MVVAVDSLEIHVVACSLHGLASLVHVLVVVLAYRRNTNRPPMFEKSVRGYSFFVAASDVRHWGYFELVGK